MLGWRGSGSGARHNAKPDQFGQVRRQISGVQLAACSADQLDLLSARRQARLRAAGRQFEAAVHAMRASGDQDVVTRLLGGQSASVPAPFEHRPAEDVSDPHTGYHYFLHRHEAPRGEWAHLHLFKRWHADSLGKSVTTHLVGLSLTRQGRPRGWFCVNRWVTDEFWQPWSQTARWLQGFEVHHGGTADGPSLQPVHRWLQALIRCHEPDLKRLLQQRDHVQAGWVCDDPSTNVFEDRQLDVIGFSAIDLPSRLRWCLQHRSRRA